MIGIIFLQVIYVFLQNLNKISKSSLKIVILHSLCYLQSLIIQVSNNGCLIPSAFYEIMINLSKEVPVFNHTTIDTLLQNALVKSFTVSHRLIFYILTYIGIDDVVESIIVGA